MSVDPTALEALGREVAQEIGVGPGPARVATQRQLVGAHALGRAPSGAHRWRWALVTAAVGAAACAAVALAVWSRSPADYWVGGGTSASRDGAFLRAAPAAPLPARFRSGSTFVLAPGSSARMATASRTRIRLTLLQGAVTSTVQGLRGGRWTVEAGPYDVTALGTEFTVRWDPVKAALEVTVAHGTVSIDGAGLSPEGTRLSAGQRLHVERDGELVVRTTVTASPPAAARPAMPPSPPVATPAPAEASPVAAAPPPAETPASGTSRAPRGTSPRAIAAVAAPPVPAEVPVAASQPASAPAPRATSTDPAWRQAYLRGDYSAAVAAAERAGLPSLLRSLPAEQLRQLADAARFARRGALARQTLVAIRERFAGTSHARLAAFLLGRTAEDLLGDPASAASWFGIYLREDPSGALAEEALGRRIDACLKVGLKREAREAATRYLQRHPGGVFAAAARAALE
jgi:hypothetical protein